MRLRRLNRVKVVGCAGIKRVAGESRNTAVEKPVGVISGGSHGGFDGFGPAPRHRIIAEGRDNSIRWAFFEPIDPSS